MWYEDVVAENADPYGMTAKKSNGKSNSKKQIPCGNEKKGPFTTIMLS